MNDLCMTCKDLAWRVVYSPMFAPCLYAFNSVGGFCGRNRRAMGKIPVFLVFIFIVWVYIAWLFNVGYVLTVYYANATVLCFQAVFHFCFINLMLSFFLAWYTAPWTPVGDHSMKTCKKCLEFKPERTHHCSMCEMCILRMDHHCIFIGNCVGKHNHKFFLLFLYYIGWTCSIAALAWYLYMPLEDQYELGDYARLKAFTAAIVPACVALVLIPFAVWHFLLVSLNVTSLESFAYCCISPCKLKRSNFPYYLSVYENFCEVLGDSVALWLLPVNNIPKNSDGRRASIV